jgi:hypothetical protein
MRGGIRGAISRRGKRRLQGTSELDALVVAREVYDGLVPLRFGSYGGNKGLGRHRGHHYAYEGEYLVRPRR